MSAGAQSDCRPQISKVFVELVHYFLQNPDDGFIDIKLEGKGTDLLLSYVGFHVRRLSAQ